jgi:GTP-binding protein
MKALASATGSSAMSSAPMVLLHLVSALEEDRGGSLPRVRHELEAYGHGIAEKPEVVALSQVDVLDAEARAEKVRALKKAAGRAPFELSAITGEGMTGALRALRDVIVKDRADQNIDNDAGHAED